MKRLIILLSCMFLPTLAFASSFRVIYDGGPSSSAQAGKQIRLYIDSSQIRIVNKKPRTVAPTSPINPKLSSGQSLHRQSGAAIGIGAFEIGICSRTTVTSSGENKRSITLGVSVAKPPVSDLDLRILWFQKPDPLEAGSAVPKSNGSHQELRSFPPPQQGERLEPIRCLAPA